MEQRRGGGRQHAADPQGQQAGIDGQDGAVVAADAPEHPLGQAAQGGQLPQVGGQQGDVRHLPGQVGGVLHGHGHVGGGQGGGVVDPVPHHDEPVAPGLVALHQGGLVRRQHLGPELVDAQLLADGPGGGLLVAGEHDHPADAQRPQGGDGLGGLRPGRVAEEERAGQLPADGQIEHRPAVSLGLDPRLLLRCADDPLVLKDEVAAADEGPLPLQGGGHAVGHHILHLGVALLVVQALLLGGPGHRPGHAVGEVLLHAGGAAEQLVLPPAGEVDHPLHLGAGGGEGARLVKDDGVRLGKGLQMLAALDHDPVGGGLPHGGDDGDGGGQLDGAGVVHHQHRQGPGEAAGKQTHQQGPGEAEGHDGVGQPLGLALGPGLQGLGVLDEAHDLLDAALPGQGGDPDDQAALLQHGAGVDGGARPLVDGEGLTGHGRLVDHGVAVRHRAVHRDQGAGAHPDALPRGQRPHGHRLLGAVPVHPPHRVHVDSQALAQGGLGALAGVVLQQAGQPEQEHHRAGGGPLPLGDGPGDGGRVQHGHIQPALPQAVQALPPIARRAPQGDQAADGGGQEPFLQKVPGRQAGDAAEEVVVHLPQLVGVPGGAHGEGVPPQAVQHRQGGGPAVPPVEHQHAAVDGAGLRPGDPRTAQKQGGDAVALLLGERVGAEAHPQAARLVIRDAILHGITPRPPGRPSAWPRRTDPGRPPSCSGGRPWPPAGAACPWRCR